MINYLTARDAVPQFHYFTSVEYYLLFKESVI